ncbi:MAG: acyl-CoA dehydrogenase, partial [Pseudomonadales bacterium]|nr:acyl-CoA dehydrogenase [Pseudomonadales bacterium]
MDFTFSDDQRVLCDNVKQFLHKEISADQIRSGWDTDTGRDPGLWQKMVELGLTAMLVPESYGGLGMNELDFVLLAQECGRVALCEPLVETALVATPLLACQAQRDTRCATLLEKIASGERRVAVGHAVNPTVSDAHIADYLLLPSGNEYHLVERERVTLIPLQSVDPSRRLFKVDWRAEEETRLVNGAPGVSAMAATLNRGALGMA